MKFAFSTLAAPSWDFPAVAARAKEYGYDGVELRGFLNESILTASNIFLSEPRKVREIFKEQHVQISCLSSSIAFAANRRRDRQSAQDLMTFIDTARELDCPMVKISDTQMRPGQSRDEAAAALAKWLSPLGDYAADREVIILIENLLSFRHAKELWIILEMMSHPAVAACWDVFNAALIGEVPAISVPTLNNRIQYVQVKDATLGPLGASFGRLGEGNVKVQDLMRRLMGIGYEGWVSFEWEKAWLPNMIGEPEDMLPDALKKLREWTTPPEAPVKKGHAPTADKKTPAPTSDAAPAAAH
jgi:sugar phosphate isomerase/epimerase